MEKWVVWSAVFMGASSALAGTCAALGGRKFRFALGLMAALGTSSAAIAYAVERAGARPAWLAGGAVAAFFLALGVIALLLGYPLAGEKRAPGSRGWLRVLFLALASVPILAVLPQLGGMGRWGRGVWAIPATSALPGVACYRIAARGRGPRAGLRAREARVSVAGRVLASGGILLISLAVLAPRTAALEGERFLPLVIPSLAVLGGVAVYLVVMLALGAYMGRRRGLAR